MIECKRHFDAVHAELTIQEVPTRVVEQDVNADNKLDIVLGGNLSAVKPEVGKYDALYGLVLEGDGTGDFKVLNSQQSGIKITGEIRHIKSLNTRKGKILSFVRNNDTIKFFRKND